MADSLRFSTSVTWLIRYIVTVKAVGYQGSHPPHSRSAGRRTCGGQWRQRYLEQHGGESVGCDHQDLRRSSCSFGSDRCVPSR